MPQYYGKTYNIPMYCIEYYNPKHLIHSQSFFDNKDIVKRLLYISGLKYKYNETDSVTYMDTYIYDVKDFIRYIGVLTLLIPDDTFTYNKAEIRKFFDV